MSDLEKQDTSGDIFRWISLIIAFISFDVERPNSACHAEFAHAVEGRVSTPPITYRGWDQNFNDSRHARTLYRKQ